MQNCNALLSLTVPAAVAAAAAAAAAEAEALLASLDPDERQAVLEALAKKRKKAEKAARLEAAEVSMSRQLCLTP